MDNKILGLSVALGFLLWAINSIENRPLERIAFEDTLRGSPISSVDGRYMAGFLTHSATTGAQIYGPGGFSTTIDALGASSARLYWTWDANGGLWVYDQTHQQMQVWSQEGADFQAKEWSILSEDLDWKRTACTRSFALNPPEAILPLVWSREQERLFMEESGLSCASRLW